VISQEPGAGDPGSLPDDLGAQDLGERDLEDEGSPAEETPNHRRVGRAVREWILVIGGALVVALLIRTFLFQAYEIPSPSMVDTLNVGDRVLVNKLSYKLHDVHRGDVVVFKRPPGEPDPQIKDLIKRVIGLPGETLVFRDCRVFVDGKALVEPYVEEQCTDPPQDTVDPDGDGSVGCSQADATSSSRCTRMISSNEVSALKPRRSALDASNAFGQASMIRMIAGSGSWRINLTA
jgi:signal peptidase I